MASLFPIYSRQPLARLPPKSDFFPELFLTPNLSRTPNPSNSRHLESHRPLSPHMSTALPSPAIALLFPSDWLLSLPEQAALVAPPVYTSTHTHHLCPSILPIFVLLHTIFQLLLRPLLTHRVSSSCPGYPLWSLLTLLFAETPDLPPAHDWLL